MSNPEDNGKEVGRVTRFFDKISVAVIELSDTLKAGDRIKIKGATTDFEQEVDSMQIEHETLEEATAGQTIGMKVSDKVRTNDRVFVI
jgi:putative protease